MAIKNNQDTGAVNIQELLSPDHIRSVLAISDEIERNSAILRDTLSVSSIDKTIGKKFEKMVREEEEKLQKSDRTKTIKKNEDDEHPITLPHDYYMRVTDGAIIKGLDKIKEVSPRTIFPYRRIIDIDDSSRESVGIYWKRLDKYCYQELSLDTVRDSRKLHLEIKADAPVTDNHVKDISEYLLETFVENADTESMETVYTASRNGWTKDRRLVPYAESLRVVGQPKNENFAKLIASKGDFIKWRNMMHYARQNVAVRAMFSASIGSLLLHIVDGLPFILHIKGASGLGKTVGLRCAASIFGSSKIEAESLVLSLSSTNYALEMLLGARRHFPAFCDESQTGIDAMGRQTITDNVYRICEGVGKERGKRSSNADVRHADDWQLATIMTGEGSLFSGVEYGGQLARVVEIDMPKLNHCAEIIETIDQNYGHAGEKIAQYLQETPWDTIRAEFQMLVKKAEDTGISGKQAQIIAILNLGDAIYLRAVEGCTVPEGVPNFDFSIYGKREQDVNMGARLFKSLCEWVEARINVNFYEFDPNHHIPGLRDMLKGRIIYGRCDTTGEWYIIPAGLEAFAECKHLHKPQVLDALLREGYLNKVSRSIMRENNPYKGELYMLVPQKSIDEDGGADTVNDNTVDTIDTICVDDDDVDSDFDDSWTQLVAG